MKDLKFNFSSDQKKYQEFLNQDAKVIWLYGLPASGKSTIANCLNNLLLGKGKYSVILDGDSLRGGLCKDLDFTKSDRLENIRRASEVAKMFFNSGAIVICSFVTPTVDVRKVVRNVLGNNFHFVFIDTDLNECIDRDPKGLYKSAIEGSLKSFTGVSAEFEAKEDDALIVKTKSAEPEECAKLIFSKFFE